MNTKSIIIGLLVLGGLMSSCDKDNILVSNNFSSTEYNLTDYNGLKISSVFNVYVTFSDIDEKIVVKANDNIQKHVLVYKEGNNLVMKLDKITPIGNTTLDVFIKVKNIKNYDLSGGAGVILENKLVSDYASIKLNDVSNFHGELELNKLDYTAMEVSDSELFGSVDSLNARLDGVSNVKGYDLFIKNLDIKLSDSSEANLSVSESIDVEASEVSTLRYKGQATIGKLKLSGDSEVIKKG